MTPHIPVEPDPWGILLVVGAMMLALTGGPMMLWVMLWMNKPWPHKKPMISIASPTPWSKRFNLSYAKFRWMQFKCWFRTRHSRQAWRGYSCDEFSIEQLECLDCWKQLDGKGA